MNKYEFFHDKEGCITDEIYDLTVKNSRKFSEFSDAEISDIFDYLLKFPEARNALLHLNRYFPTQKRKILSIFIDCNWAIIDNIPDISDDKLNYEFVPCKHKTAGKCPYNGKGIVCQLHEMNLFTEANL